MVAKQRGSLPRRLVIFGASALGCSAVWASGGAHEHGAAELLLSSEGRDVQITINAPAQSVVGFETAAVTAEQRTAVEHAEAILMAPSDLFALEDKSCELIDATVDMSSIVGAGSAQSQPNDHAEEHADQMDKHAGHGEAHTDQAEEHTDPADEHVSHDDNHGHQNPDHDDEGESPATDSHSDVSATYTFECESDNALTRIVFHRGELPFGLERINVFWVTDWGQGVAQATPQSPQVNLRN